MLFKLDADTGVYTKEELAVYRSYGFKFRMERGGLYYPTYDPNLDIRIVDLEHLMRLQSNFEVPLRLYGDSLTICDNY